ASALKYFVKWLLVEARELAMQIDLKLLTCRRSCELRRFVELIPSNAEIQISIRSQPYLGIQPRHGPSFNKDWFHAYLSEQIKCSRQTFGTPLRLNSKVIVGLA